MKTKFLLSVLLFCFTIFFQETEAQVSNKPSIQSTTRGTAGTDLITSNPPSAFRNLLHPQHQKPAIFKNLNVSAKAGRDAPANDDPCSITADSLTIGQSLTWTGTTQDSDGDVWQAFTLSSCANVSFNFCGTTPTYSNDYMFPYLGDCQNIISEFYPPLTAPDCGDGNPITTFYTLSAGTYYFPIYQVSEEVLNYNVVITAAECAPQPPNDNPCNVIPDQLAVGDTLEWSGITAGSLDYMVTEAFTLTTCAVVTLNFCGSSPTYQPFFVKAYSGECDSLLFYKEPPPFNIVCEDGNPIVSIYDFEPGTYYFNIVDVSGGIGSTYNISVTASACAPVPPNDLICDALIQPLSIGDSISFQGTTAGATNSEGNTTGNVWEAFILTQCADVTFNWCGSTSADQWTNFSLISGDCSNPDGWTNHSLVADTESCDDGNRLMVAYILNPGTYYIQILEPTSAYNNYQLTASATVCSPLPSNDICSALTAQLLTSSTPITFNGSTVGASSTGDFGDGWVNEQVPTVWHAFTLSSCSHVTIQYCATVPAFEYIWSFISPSCPADSVFIPGSYNFQQCLDNATIIYYDLPPGTYYIPVLQDSTFATGPYSITLTADNCGTYCIGYALNTVPDYEKISNVNFAGIDNSSTSSFGYEDFAAISDTVIKGESYPLSVTLSNSYFGDNVRVWIDYNRDNSFAADELVFVSDTSAGPYSGNITIPVDAATGATRMRIRMDDVALDHGSNPNPCGYASFGQVEDYTLIIEEETGINTINSDAWLIYPNPGNGDFTIRNGGENARVLIEIIDISGRIIYSERSMVLSNSYYEVSASDLIASGIYNVRISTDNFQASKKVIVW
jgi:hypothetical protein